jgi:DNA-binding NtrC family response regulator
MPKNTEICKIMIVDDDVDCAREIAYELEQIRPDLLKNQKLDIEISNTAYFVAKQIENCTGKMAPWDIILSDVYMPIPSHPLQKKIAQETAELDEISYKKKYKWKFWKYNYIWNSADPKVTPDHGGLYLAKKIKHLKNEKNDFNNLKVVLISDKLIDPNVREKVYEFFQSEKSWLNFEDKAKWEQDTEDWPDNLNKPSVFRWSIIHAINERKSESWGVSLSNKNFNYLVFSKIMKEISTTIKTLGKNQNVDKILITGPPGVGKTELAQRIHEVRMEEFGAGGEFVVVDCNLFTDNLFGSSLFGNVEGAFTDAKEDKEGIIENTKNGTLFFDEIGDLSPANQGKLLRLLQNKKFLRVGDNQEQELEANLIIFATNKDLNYLTKNKDFRTDLYERMNSNRIKIPSLNDRKDEIIPLAKYFLEMVNKDVNLSEDAAQLLKEHHWDGNVRELKDKIIRAANFCTSTELNVSDIKEQITNKSEKENSSFHSINNMEIQITPENIVAGKLKWKQIQQNSDYEQRAAVLLVARSIWNGRQTKLADLLSVIPDTFFRFFSTVKKEIKNRNLDIQDLKPYVNRDHYLVLEKIFSDIVN